MTVATDSLETFYGELESKHMDALWRGRTPVKSSGEPRAPYPPFSWRWADIRPFMTRAGELVEPGFGADRRVVQLVHPSLPTVRAASHTLTANVQMVLPGEVAPVHRHTMAAIRFIIEGEAAITTVDGEPIEMRRGDLVLTPGWHWHGHQNLSNGPVLWMDSLDRPLTFALRQILVETFPESSELPSKPPGYSGARFGSGPLRPLSSPNSPISPVLSYRWSEVEPALQRLAEAGAADPFDDVAFEYTNPLTGGYVMPTIGCRIQMLRPGIHTRAHRHAYSSNFHVFRGSGSTIVDGERIAWSQGDFLTLPPFCWHEHCNDGAEQAVLFSAHDAPVIESLGLAREDLYPSDDGRQARA